MIGDMDMVMDNTMIGSYYVLSHLMDSVIDLLDDFDSFACDLLVYNLDHVSFVRSLLIEAGGSRRHERD